MPSAGHSQRQERGRADDESSPTPRPTRRRRRQRVAAPGAGSVPRPPRVQATSRITPLDSRSDAPARRTADVRRFRNSVRVVVSRRMTPFDATDWAICGSYRTMHGPATATWRRPSTPRPRPPPSASRPQGRRRDPRLPRGRRLRRARPPRAGADRGDDPARPRARTSRPSATGSPRLPELVGVFVVSGAQLIPPPRRRAGHRRAVRLRDRPADRTPRGRRRQHVSGLRAHSPHGARTAGRVKRAAVQLPRPSVFVAEFGREHVALVVAPLAADQ